MEESVSFELTIVHKVVINPAKKTRMKLPAINEYTTRGAAAIAANGQPVRTPNNATKLPQLPHACLPRAPVLKPG